MRVVSWWACRIKPAATCGWVAYGACGQHRRLLDQGCCEWTVMGVAFTYVSEFAQCPLCAQNRPGAVGETLYHNPVETEAVLSLALGMQMAVRISNWQ